MRTPMSRCPFSTAIESAVDPSRSASEASISGWNEERVRMVIGKKSYELGPQTCDLIDRMARSMSSSKERQMQDPV